MGSSRVTEARRPAPSSCAVRWEPRSTYGLWDSPGIDRKDTFSFTKPGEYRYMCREHLLEGMVGTITVK